VACALKVYSKPPSAPRCAHALDGETRSFEREVSLMVGLNKRTGLMNTAIDVVQRDLAGAAPTQRSEAHIEEVWMGTDDVPAKATHDNAPARALEEDTVRVGRQLCRRVPEEKLTSWPPCLVPCCTAR
jgi:hypothetical protein